MSAVTIGDVTASYSALADRYIEVCGSVDQTHPDDLAFLARHLGQSSGTVIDAGCGPGHLTAFLGSLGLQAEGIDLVPEFIAHARHTYPSTPYGIGSLLSLPVANGTVGGILSWYSLIHLDPKVVPEALAEFHRALRPGGVLILGFFPGEELETFGHKVIEAFFWPIEELQQLLTAAGFRIEETCTRSDPELRPHAAIAARKVEHEN